MKVKVGFIGFGKRVENVYMPLFRKAESIFEISGFCTRRKDRATEIAGKFGLKNLQTRENVSKNSDIVIAFCPPEVQYDLLSEITQFSDKILIETPTIDHRILHLDMATSSKICVAEQWPYLPIEQFKNLIIKSGLISTPFLAQNDCRSLDYHAIAQLRTYLGRDLIPTKAFGSSVGSDIPKFIDKNGNIKSEPEFWDISHVKFNNGSILSHNFSYNCKIAPFRSIQTLRYYSSNGTAISGRKDDKEDDYEIIDARYLSEDMKTSNMNVEVKKLSGRAVIEISDSASGVTWANPYGNMGLTDQETAICTLVDCLSRGDSLYSTRDSFIDSVIMNAIKRSCATGSVVDFS